MKYILAVGMVFMLGCSQDTVNLPDLGPEVRLLQAKDQIQDARLDALELRVDSLEDRMLQAEDDIDVNEEKLSELCDSVGDLEEDLSDLRGDLRDAVRELRSADRQTRRMLRSEVRRLSRKLTNEIRNRKRADNRLQSQIDDLESDVEDLSDRLSRDEFIVYYVFSYLYNELNSLEASVNASLAALSDRLDVVEGDIVTINNSLRRVRNAIISLRGQVSSNYTSLLDAINTISLTPGPQGEQGIQGLPGVEGPQGPAGEDATGDECQIEFREASNGSPNKADIYAVCDGSEYRLKKNANISEVD